MRTKRVCRAAGHQRGPAVTSAAPGLTDPGLRGTETRSGHRLTDTVQRITTSGIKLGGRKERGVKPSQINNITTSGLHFQNKSLSKPLTSTYLR